MKSWVSLGMNSKLALVVAVAVVIACVSTFAYVVLWRRKQMLLLPDGRVMTLFG